MAVVTKNSVSLAVFATAFAIPISVWASDGGGDNEAGTAHRKDVSRFDCKQCTSSIGPAVTDGRLLRKHFTSEFLRPGSHAAVVRPAQLTLELPDGSRATLNGVPHDGGVLDLEGGRRHTLTIEAQMLARACGKTYIHSLEPEDLAALTMEASALAQVPLAGTQHTVGRPDMTRF